MISIQPEVIMWVLFNKNNYVLKLIEKYINYYLYYYIKHDDKV